MQQFTAGCSSLLHQKQWRIPEHCAGYCSKELVPLAHVPLASSKHHFGTHDSQQLPYGVVSEGFFCGEFAEFLWKVRGIFKKYVLLRQEKVQKFCGKLRKFRGSPRKMFWRKSAENVLQ